MDLATAKANLDTSPDQVSDSELLALYQCVGSPLLRDQSIVPPDQSSETGAKVRALLLRRARGTNA